MTDINRDNAKSAVRSRAYSLLEIKSIKEDQRVIEGIASTPTPDRVGDIVVSTGAVFKLPMPLLWQHDSHAPVGNVTFAKPTESGIPFRAQIANVTEPGTLKDRLDEAWQSVKAGLVRAVSIGFTALKYEILKDGGYSFNEWEWLELSLVTIPANAEATITNIRSIDTELRAASGREQRGAIKLAPAGASAKQATSVVKAKEAGPMKKTIAEQISAFEATRQAKSARMDEIMDAAAEKGETLDDAAKQEYDTLDAEVKSVDDHLVRLRAREKTNAAAAVEVKGASGAEAGASRAGVRVENMRANLPKGVPFARFVMALAKARGNRMEALAIAENNKTWMDQTPEVATSLKAAVAAGTTTDADWASALVQYQIMASEFIEYLRPRTIIGRIPGLRQVPFKIKVPRQTAAASVGWVGEGKPRTVSKLAFDTVSLDFFNISGIVALTNELLRFSNPAAETLVRDDLASGIIQFMDSEFIDPDVAAVSNVSPASVTNGVTPTAASGTDYAALKTDVKGVMDAFLAANITPDFVLMRQSLALSLSLMQTSLGVPQFPNLNMNGGEIFGLPAITSENIPFTEDSPQQGTPIIFGKASEIMLADDGQVVIDISQEASLQMDSAPDDPASASTVMISLFQQNMTGVRAMRTINWLKRRAEAVQFISSAKYA